MDALAAAAALAPPLAPSPSTVHAHQRRLQHISTVLQPLAPQPACSVYGVEQHREFPLVQVHGTAHEMGLQHGRQAALLIRRYLDFITKDAADRAVKIQHALTYIPGIEALNARYMEEVRGLANGAGISFGEAMLCQTRGAGPADGRRSADTGGPPANEGCTAFAFTGAATRDGQTFAGQNQDINPVMDTFGIVLHLTPSDGRPRACTFTFAGQLGYMGMNHLGVSHFANAVPDPTATTAAAPRAGVVRVNHYPLKRTCFEMTNVQEVRPTISAHNPANADIDWTLPMLFRFMFHVHTKNVGVVLGAPEADTAKQPCQYVLL
jgi:hypothetical protein